MKTLKLDHTLADLVRQGKKTSTWRIYDDKNISVNDNVELIDKVDPANPETWTRVGIAHITMVVEKQLGDIVAADFVDHEPYSSQEAMLEDFQKYYGPQVSLETPIKMIHFSMGSLTGIKSKTAITDDKKTTKITEVKLYTDGGSRGNPGPSASGYVIMNMQEDILVKKGIYLGVTTNNQAEYQALKLGLEEAQRLGARTVHVYMDSLLVVNQMRGIFKVKNRDLWPIHESIKEVVATFKHVSFTHVPRELNKLADHEVNVALDTSASEQTGTN